MSYSVEQEKLMRGGETVWHRQLKREQPGERRMQPRFEAELSAAGGKPR